MAAVGVLNGCNKKRVLFQESKRYSWWVDDLIYVVGPLQCCVRIIGIPEVTKPRSVGGGRLLKSPLLAFGCWIERRDRRFGDCNGALDDLLNADGVVLCRHCGRFG